MSIDYTTTNLIADIKRRGSIPTAQSLFFPADFVALANDQLFMNILPIIHEAREDYFLTIKDVAIVAGQADYTIPSRAAGGMLRDVVIVDAGGNEAAIPFLGLPGVKNNLGLVNNSSAGFYFKDNKIVIYPTPTGGNGQSVRFKYERRPNQLILPSAAGRILSINSGADQITLASTPTGFSTSKLYDIISNVPPFVSFGDDLAITNLAANVMTLAADIPTGVAVDMYVCEAGESPIPQIIPEGWWLLSQLTCVKCLESMDDRGGLDKAREEAKKMVDAFRNLIDPRSDESPEKVVNRSGIFDYSGGYGWPGTGRW